MPVRLPAPSYVYVITEVGVVVNVMRITRPDGPVPSCETREKSTVAGKSTSESVAAIAYKSVVFSAGSGSCGVQACKPITNQRKKYG